MHYIRIIVKALRDTLKVNFLYTTFRMMFCEFKFQYEKSKLLMKSQIVYSKIFCSVTLPFRWTRGAKWELIIKDSGRD